MANPTEPSTIDDDDRGERSLRLEMEHEAAIEFVRECFEAEGFGVPVEFSPSALLNEKVDAGCDPYYVLGACNPAMAARALELTPRIGAIFPCNVIVREVEPGVQVVHHVSIMRIARLVGLAPDSPEWAELVADTGAMAEAAYERIETAA